MELIEVKILNYTILLPLQAGATVLSVSTAALNEVKSFNLKKAPQKVLYVRDDRGRVLSSSLALPLVTGTIEIVVEDYTSNDAVTPAETEKLYREWQLWTISQLKETIQFLSYQDRPTPPDKQLLMLLQEVSQCAHEEVQLSCLSVYRILLTKFPDKTVVMSAAESISKIFLTTSVGKVAVCALECFQHLSPLQLKLFDSVRCMRAMLDIDTHLVRFADMHGEIFHAFEHVLALIDDEELKSILEQSKQRYAEGGMLPSAVLLEEEKEATPRKHNLGRLQSLIQSEDAKIRLYALEKLKKLLRTAHDRPSSSGDQLSSSFNSLPKPSDSVTDLHVSFSFTSDQEVFGLLQSLLAALKACIKARPAPGKPSRERSVPAKTDSEELSMAAKLIQAGLRAPETDLPAVQLILECLQLTVLFPRDVSISTDMASSIAQIPRNRKINALTGLKLTNIQKIFIVIAKESYRLLFTLSHADENKLDPRLADISERSALFFGLAVICGMPRGWGDCALRLETITVSRSLAVQSPNYRLFMVLSYLSHIAKKVELKGKGPPMPAAEEESAAITALKDLLAGNKFAILKSLWWWSIGERSNFLIRRYALGCIAPATVFSGIASFLWKLDPIPRLLEVLTKACRTRSTHLTFLQTDKRLFRRLEQYGSDEEPDEHLSDSYSDTDYSSDEEVQEHAHPTGRKDRRRSVQGEHAFKADHKIIRLVLKTMVNLLHAPGAPFNEQNKAQLSTYLQNLEIGVDPERGTPGISLMEIASQDRIASFYCKLLLVSDDS